MTRRRAFLAFLSCLSATAIAVADHPARFAEVLLPRDGRPTGDALNVSVIGQWGDGPSTAFVAAGEIGYHGRGCIVEAVAIGGDKAPGRELGRVTLPSRVTDLERREGMLYVADYNGGLRVIDVADPTLPVEIGHLDIGGVCRGVALTGDVALVAADGAGLVLVDISDPTDPRLVSQVYPMGPALDVGVHDASAVVAVGASGLQLIDISDPAHPVIGPSQATSGFVWSVEVARDLAYTAEDVAGLAIYDLTGPAGPTRLGSVALMPWIMRVRVAGDLAYAAASVFGFYLVDVSDPTHPAGISYVSDQGDLYHADFDGEILYVADGDDGLKTFDARNPLAPVLVGERDTPGSTFAVEVRDGLAAAATLRGGLRLLEVSDPSLPVAAGVYATDAQVWGSTFFGTRALVADDLAGYAVLDVSDANAPAVLGRLELPQIQALAAEVRDDLAYLACAGFAGAGLRVADLADPAQPQWLGYLPINGVCWAVAVDGDRAYLAASNVGLVVADISDGSLPGLVSQFHVGGEARDVALVDGLVYVAVKDPGGGALSVVDVRGPRSPQEIGRLRWHQYPDVLGVAVQLPYAYLACRTGGVRVVDVSDPTAPAEVGYFQTGHGAWDVQWHDGRVYVADRECGVWVLQNDLDSTPVQLAGLAARRAPAGVTVRWETTTSLGVSSYRLWRRESLVASVSARDPGSYVVVDGSAPLEAVAYWVEGTMPDGGSLWFGPTWVAAAHDGGPVALRTWPNPVRSGATFAFALPEPTEIKLEVFDLRGRCVASLAREGLGAGSHQVAWDRRDESGKRLAAGTYLARLSGADFVRTTKVLVAD